MIQKVADFSDKIMRSNKRLEQNGDSPQIISLYRNSGVDGYSRACSISA
jgi:hypothetical protein